MTKPTKTPPFTPAPGKRFRTNDVFRRVTGGYAFTGTTVRRHTPISGCWTCTYDGSEGTHYVHESYMIEED